MAIKCQTVSSTAGCYAQDRTKEGQYLTPPYPSKWHHKSYFLDWNSQFPFERSYHRLSIGSFNVYSIQQNVRRRNSLGSSTCLKAADKGTV